MNCLPQSLHLYIWLEPLRPFLTTFEEQQKKHFFYHIINNMAQIYEYQDIDAHVILLFVHPAKVLKVHNTLININITAISAPEMTYTPIFM